VYECSVGKCGININYRVDGRGFGWYGE